MGDCCGLLVLQPGRRFWDHPSLPLGAALGLDGAGLAKSKLEPGLWPLRSVPAQGNLAGSIPS